MAECLRVTVLSVCSASDNIPKADDIRTLVKDIWDTRIAKLRLSADSFIRQQEAHAKVPPRSYLPAPVLCTLLLVFYISPPHTQPHTPHTNGLVNPTPMENQLEPRTVVLTDRKSVV